MSTKKSLPAFSFSPAKACVARFTNALSRRCPSVSPLFAGLNIARWSRSSQYEPSSRVPTLRDKPSPLQSCCCALLVHSVRINAFRITLLQKTRGWGCSVLLFGNRSRRRHTPGPSDVQMRLLHPECICGTFRRSDASRVSSFEFRPAGLHGLFSPPALHSAPVAAPPPRCHNRISLGRVVLRGPYGIA